MTFTMLKINTYCFSLSTLRNTILSRSTLGFNAEVVRKEEDPEIACAVERAMFSLVTPKGTAGQI